MSYLPAREAELKAFALNFAALVLANPNIYALVAGDATQISDAAQDFATKLDLAVNVPTRTRASIIDKNNAKADLLAILRGYAMMIKSNRAVADSAKANLGLNVDDFVATPIAAPQTAPIVSVVDMKARRHVLRFADMLTPDARAQPEGANGLQLFCHIGDAATPPASQLAARFQGVFSRHTASIDFELADAGKTAYYFARWQTARGLVGPWSDMVRMGIAA